ncbi:glycosyltransferase family A protein [Lachnoclostridium sp. Marseille-P6806]|uniref:glycosyltransferase family A protein n=1 Tax=Lachnoclostridium sp. Marseille-P6806 TaxID=2364793 RepID=UPI0010318CD6|nr:glycosyltransferase family A protein [Lachnoclostridium sp. Marseille-P6806]
MIYFGVPLRAKAVSRDWGRVSAQFERTLRSVCRQTSPEFKVLVACHDIPEGLRTDPRVEFLRAETPYPASREEMMLDKGWKVSMIARRVRELGGGYVMLVDADDLISHRIAAYAAAHPGKSGFLSASAYLYRDGSDCCRKIRAPHRVCGSCAIVHYEPEELPPELPRDLWDDSPREKWVIRRPHRQVPELLRAQGRPLERLPFPSTIYVQDTGDNHSRLGGGDLGWKRRAELFFRRRLPISGLEEEFGEIRLPDGKEAGL